ncbi:MAG: hypothetical protein V3V06_00780, partial [Dehalococcoidia bacterium]
PVLSALGISPALSSIIKRAREAVPEGASLHIFSTEPGHFRGRFVGGSGTTIAAPSDSLAPLSPSGGESSDPLPPSPPSSGDFVPQGPPPPPPIPPDEIAPDEDDESATASEPAPPASFNAPVLSPGRSNVASAYEAALEGEVNPITAAAASVERQVDTDA